MHTLRLKIDDSIFEQFMGLIDILPKEKYQFQKILSMTLFHLKKRKRKFKMQ